MKNLMILTLLLFLAVACKSEVVEEVVVEEVPAVEEAPVEVVPEVTPAVEEVLPEEVVE